MAATAIAASLRENRNDLIREVNGSYTFETFYMHCPAAFNPLSRFRHNRGIAITDRRYESAPVHLHDSARLNFIDHAPSEIAPWPCRHRLSLRPRTAPGTG